MHRALVLTKYPDEYQRLIEAEQLPDLEVVATSDVADGLARAGDSGIVLGDPARVVQALPHLTGLQWVQLSWAGVEPMLDPALRRDYVLTNIRGVFGPLMSEYVFGYLLAHERKILPRLEAQREGRWDTTLPGTLQGKTIGLVGVGSIGAHLAATAKHFGMQVRGFTRSSADCPHVDAYFHGDDKAAFATGLDYLVAVLPNTGGTRRIVDAAMLGALRAAGGGRQRRPRRHARSRRARQRAEQRPAVCRRPRRLPGGTAASGPRAVAHPEGVHHQPHRRAQLPRRHRLGVRRQLSTFRQRQGARSPG